MLVLLNTNKLASCLPQNWAGYQLYATQFQQLSKNKPL